MLKKLQVAPSALDVERGATIQKTTDFSLKRKQRKLLKGSSHASVHCPWQCAQCCNRETGNTCIIPDTTLCS